MELKKRRRNKIKEEEKKRWWTRWITRPRIGSPSLVGSIDRVEGNKINHGYSEGRAGYIYRGRQNFRAINYSKVCRPILGIQIFGSIWESIRVVDGVRLSASVFRENHFFSSSLGLSLLIGSNWTELSRWL